MIITLQTLIFFRESLLNALDRILRPYYSKFSLTFGRKGDVSDEDESDEQVFAEFDDEKGVVFYPPVYLQRYAAVSDCLMDERWCGKLDKVVDLGYHDMSFIKYLKEVSGIRCILGVDIESIPLRCSSDLMGCDEYGPKRENPLQVTLFQGNAADPDYRLIGCDAVIAIEMIEHMLPHDLDRLVHTVFGFVKPRVAIFTTPNGDFNVLFKAMEKNGFRRWDHFFEWSREQFHDWCSNILARYPEYTVSCKGIGPGPPGTLHLGCCSQMAVFTSKDYHKQQDLNLDSLALVSNAPSPYNVSDLLDTWDSSETPNECNMICPPNNEESFTELYSEKQSCVTILITSPAFSLASLEHHDKTSQCNLDIEAGKNYLMFDYEQMCFDVVVPRRKMNNRVYMIEDVTSRLNCTTLQVKKFSKTSQNLIAKNTDSLAHTRDVVDEIRHLTKMLNFNKDCQPLENGVHIWHNINWGDNAPYWNQYYKVVREYNPPYEAKSEESRITELISDEINRLIDNQFSDDFSVDLNRLEIPIEHLMNVVSHITDDVEKVKDLLEWDGYEIVDNVVIHSRLMVDNSSTLGTQEDDWQDNDTYSDWDSTDVHSTTVSEGSTMVPDFHARCIRRALDQKVRRLRTMLTADEDITTELDRIVCRLMKLALRTSKGRRSPPPTRWMQCKLLDLLTLTEKAIERRKRYFIENYPLKPISYDEPSEKSLEMRALDKIREDNTANKIVNKYRHLVLPEKPGVIEDSCAKYRYVDLELEDDLSATSPDFLKDYEYIDRHSPSLFEPEPTLTDMALYDPANDKTKLERTQAWLEEDLELVPYPDHDLNFDNDISSGDTEHSTSLSRYYKKSYKKYKTKNQCVELKCVICKRSHSKSFDRESKRDKKAKNKTSKTKTIKKVTRKKSSYNNVFKDTSNKYESVDYGHYRAKSRRKEYKSLQPTVSKPIPASLIELCHPELMIENNMETYKEHIINFSRDDHSTKFNQSTGGVAATEKSILIDIVMDDIQETIAMRRTIGTDAEGEPMGYENETLIRSVSNTVVNDYNFFDKQDVGIENDQTIFLNDINEPSTSKGIRHVSMDVQCGPDTSAPAYSILSATTSITRMPNIFTAGIKIEDSSTDTEINNTSCCINTTLQKNSTDCCTSTYDTESIFKTIAPRERAIGIKIKESVSNIAVQMESSTMTNEWTREQDSNVAEQKVTTREQGATTREEVVIMPEQESTMRQKQPDRVSSIREKKAARREQEKTVIQLQNVTLLREQEPTLRERRSTLRHQQSSKREHMANMRNQRSFKQEQELTLKREHDSPMREQKSTIQEQVSTAREQVLTMQEQMSNMRKQGLTKQKQELIVMREQGSTMREQVSSLQEQGSPMQEQVSIMREQVAPIREKMPSMRKKVSKKQERDVTMMPEQGSTMQETDVSAMQEQVSAIQEKESTIRKQRLTTQKQELTGVREQGLTMQEQVTTVQEQELNAMLEHGSIMQQQDLTGTQVQRSIMRDLESPIIQELDFDWTNTSSPVQTEFSIETKCLKSIPSGMKTEYSSSEFCGSITSFPKSPSSLQVANKISDLQINSSFSKDVGVSRKLTKYVRPKLCCGGVQVHSYRDKQTSEDIMYQGEWQNLKPKVLTKRKVFNPVIVKKITDSNLKKKISSKEKIPTRSFLRKRCDKTAASALTRTIETNKIKKNAEKIKEKTSTFVPRCVAKVNKPIRSVTKVASKVTMSSATSKNIKSALIVKKPAITASTPKDIQKITRTVDKKYLPYYLRRSPLKHSPNDNHNLNEDPTNTNICMKINKHLNLSVDSVKTNIRVNAPKPALIRSKTEEIKRSLLKFQNKVPLASYVVLRNEVEKKSSANNGQPAKISPDSGRRRGATAKRSMSPESQNSSTCSSPNSVATVRAVSIRPKTVNSRRHSSSSYKTTTANSGSENTTPNRNKKFTKRCKSAKMSDEKTFDNKENIPQTSRQSNMTSKGSDKIVKGSFLGQKKEVFIAQLKGTPPLQSSTYKKPKSSINIPKTNSSIEKRSISPTVSKKSSLKSDDWTDNQNITSASTGISNMVLVLDPKKTNKSDSPKEIPNINTRLITEWMDNSSMNTVTSQRSNIVADMRMLVEETLDFIEGPYDNNCSIDSETVILSREDLNNISVGLNSSPISFKTVIMNENNSLQSDLEYALNRSFDTTLGDESILSLDDTRLTVTDFDLLSFKSITSVSKYSEYLSANSSQGKLPAQSIRSNSVKDIYERKDQPFSTIPQNAAGAIAIQAFSGFSINGEPVIGDKPDPINLIDSETGSMAIEVSRQANSEELFVSGRSSGSIESCFIDEESVVPSWLFQIISQQQAAEDEMGPPQPLLLPLPMPDDPMYDDNGNIVEGVGLGAGAGDGRGMHSDQSQDSSGRGTSLSSSDTSSGVQSEDVLIDPAFAAQYDGVALLQDSEDSSIVVVGVNDEDNELGTAHGAAPMAPDSQSFSHGESTRRNPRAQATTASDIDADVSSLETDVPDSSDN